MDDPICPFCRIISGQERASIVYQDDLVTSFMDICPATPGHLLVVPNSHAARLADLREDQGKQVFALGRELAQALRDVDVRCEGINLYLADGRAAGQTVFHSHLHVIPRFRRDGCGLRLHASPARKAPWSELDAEAGMIRAVLNVGAIGA